MIPNEHFVQGFLHEIKLAAADRVKRTYTIEGPPEHLDKMEEVLSTLDYLGAAGASRTVKVHYDGDGRARLRFTRQGQKLKRPEDLSAQTEKDEISFGID